MKLPRKEVVERQVEAIQQTFECASDVALAATTGGQPRYGIVPPPKPIPPPPVDPTPNPPSSAGDLWSGWNPKLEPVLGSESE
jgi:hypothetical protein